MSSPVKKGLDTKKLFYNLTAWFSNSVAAKRKALWVKHGGKEDDIKNAQFIFSEDINSYDTSSLFDSEDYLIGCLTIFHARFIDACMKQQSAHKTPVSKYLMMPPGLPSELRYVTKEVTEEDNTTDTEVAKIQLKRSKNPVAESSHKFQMSDKTNTGAKADNKWISIPHVCDIPRACGPLCDFIPGTNGFTVQRNF